METLRKDTDEDRLAELGYKQDLRRDWSVLHNFGVSFSIIVSCGISFNFSCAVLLIVRLALLSKLQFQWFFRISRIALVTFPPGTSYDCDRLRIYHIKVLGFGATRIEC